MKKLLFIVALCAPWAGWGQEKTEPPMSEAEKISAKAGVMVEKTFIETGNVKGVKVEQFVVKDMTSNTTLKALRLSYEKVSQYSSDSKISVLDKDEIEGLVLALQQITVVCGEKRENYTEVTFTSRSGFKAGAYYTVKDMKWQGFLQIGSIQPAYVYLSMEEVGKFLKLVVLVKARIEAKE